ncbi:cupin domain-containing protein [Parachryseolinea silvisoli]|jgi:quercetin dioxygenase-like cupin family protein|uniref:cupin domain-containing protein n=1 Tax=Parachryseolinea silvisoli TaxID=2873601 RepID=UPI0022659778|nr:cupin domain-containing protein [Parachryseolinea silvisoli]MCD9018016.1 cupin domain-containing protein [Parachryseolinea silvisoli]
MKRVSIILGLFLIVMAAAYGQNVPKTEVVKLVESSKSWNGAALPGYPAGTPQVTILKITIPPHTALKTHKHPVINAGVVLKGELTVSTETGESMLIKAGEPIVELVNIWHSGKNDGNEPVELIVFYAGIEGTPITVPKGDGARDH